MITLEQEFDVPPQEPEPGDQRPASKAWCWPTGELVASLTKTITYVMESTCIKCFTYISFCT